MFIPWSRQRQARCLQASDTGACRRWLRTAPAPLLAALPALDRVLYMPLAACGPELSALPGGLLVETPALALLLRVRWLMAVSVIAVDGPREWVDGLDRSGRPCVRLHLLPDTDYLGWDRLLASGEPAPTMPDTPHLPALDACPLRFHRRRLAGLDVLRGETVDGLSPLGRQLAGQIAHAHTGQRERQFR
ncbi:hypothetical protein [Rhodanobacter denitrificans]|uniref:Hemin transport protein n=1 Tax=Rhodanobacter denitrificans TaxID=666685 RepID=M4NDJ9_9GAMM|nr:hypothetical protein [Rhodanobacter denitrificans]AGG87952.1 hypothetical protein R2APBS1_0787 [Rhodanobacter denitrificans]UJM87107.1 hypothetical protein LRJ86_01995 [Rhodanobacter denitrificans]